MCQCMRAHSCCLHVQQETLTRVCDTNKHEDGWTRLWKLNVISTPVVSLQLSPSRSYTSVYDDVTFGNTTVRFLLSADAYKYRWKVQGHFCAWFSRYKLPCVCVCVCICSKWRTYILYRARAGSSALWLQNQCLFSWFNIDTALAYLTNGGCQGKVTPVDREGVLMHSQRMCCTSPPPDAAIHPNPAHGLLFID